MNNGDGKKGSKSNKRIKESMKVVYISSPMKVKTSASRFRSLVQQLTGKNSDISQYMDYGDANHGSTRDDFYHQVDFDRTSPKAKEDQYQSTYSSISADDTVTSTDSFSGAMDSIDAFTSQMREHFAGIFDSDSFYDPSQLDVLGSFDELL